MKTTLIAAFVLIFCFFTNLDSIKNLNGKWTGFLKTDQGGDYALLYDFKIDGHQLSGTAKTPKGYCLFTMERSPAIPSASPL